MEQAKWDPAIADLSKAVDLKPEQTNLWYRRALARCGCGRVDEYRKDCGEMLQRFGQTDKAEDAHWVAWAWPLHDATGDWPTAVALAEKAAKSDPKSASYLNTLGAVLYRAGQFDEAAKKLKEAEASVIAPVGTRSHRPPIPGSSWPWPTAFAASRGRQGLVRQGGGRDGQSLAGARARDRRSPLEPPLTLKLLRAEAAALLGISDTPPTEKG